MFRFIGIPIIAVSFLIAGCSASSGDGDRMPAFSERDPHPSPFAEKRVLLTPESFEKPKSAATPSASVTTASLKVVVIGKNECAPTHCASNPGSVSCLISKHSERNAKLTTQFFPISLEKPLTEEQLNKWVSQDPCIVGVSNNQQYKSDIPDDPFYASQQKKYLDTVKFEKSLPYFLPNSLAPVRVAVIDSGLGTHPDIGDASSTPGVIYREDLRSSSSKTAPECSGKPFTLEQPNHPHGTMVGGVIGATQGNTLGVAGIATNAQILSFAIGNCNGQMSTAEIGNALLAALQRQAEVVNMSLGGQLTDDPGLRFSIVELLNAKTVVVVAAGNSFIDLRKKPYYPATYAINYQGLISVAWGTFDGELQQGNRVDQGSNYSPQHIKILAPGEPFAVTTTGNTYATGIRGSSLATPVVTSAAALTIGFLKAKLLRYDEAMIEFLITKASSAKKTSVEPYVRDGAVLDLEKLGLILKDLGDSKKVPAPMVTDQVDVFYNTTTKQQQLNFRLNWNLASTHYGARLGIFDARCGYSAPCMIQDFILPGNVGSKSISLSRNDVLPTLPSPSDPSLALYVNAAIYYKVYDSEGRPKNNFATDAVTRINLRDYDISKAASPLYGGVTNVRLDQQYLYVQGYACVQDSNKALPVELVDTTGKKIVANYAYFYEYMYPHGNPIDPVYWGWNPGSFSVSGRMMQTGQSGYLAGVEGNPLQILQCRVLTVAHGFEFGIKFSDIIANNLAGKKFVVNVTDYRTGAKTSLKDALGNQQFTIPEVNYQTAPSSSIAITRVSDRLSVTGSVCSQAATPVQVELSFSHWAYRCRLSNKMGFPDFNDYCRMGQLRPLPLIYDTAITDWNLFQYLTNFSYPFTKNTSNLQLTAEELAKLQSTYTTRWPNTAVYFYGDTTALNEHFNQSNYQEVMSGRPLGGIQYGDLPYAERGPANAAIISTNLADRAGSSIKPVFSGAFRYWDYYDAGEPYTDSVVAYAIDPTRTIGEYLYRTLGVRKVMRETKKYETPLSYGSTPLSYLSIPQAATEGGACPYRFSFTQNIDNISQYTPPIVEYQKAILYRGELPMAGATLVPVPIAMQEIPLDIRFFQDGVMILHLLSDYQSRTVPIKTFGRGQ